MQRPSRSLSSGSPSTLSHRKVQKRKEVYDRSIAKTEKEKVKVERDLNMLTDKLAQINESLARTVASREGFERSVQEEVIRLREQGDPFALPRV